MMARPTKYKETFAEQARYLCEQFGATDEQLAKALGVSDATVYTWKKEHPEFLEAVSQGKAAFDGREIDTSCKALAMGFYFQEERYDPESGNIVRLWKYCKPDIKAIALWKANRSGWRLPGPSDRPAGGRPLLDAPVLGNEEPPGSEGSDLADLDEAARERLRQVSVELLEARYGTTIKHVESPEVHHGDTEDTETKEPSDEG